MKTNCTAAFKPAAPPVESPAVQLKRLRMKQFTRWSRTLNTVTLLAASFFVTSCVLNYLGVHLGFGAVSALTTIASAAGAFLMKRQVEEWNFQIEAPDLADEESKIETRVDDPVDSMPTLL